MTETKKTTAVKKVTATKTAKKEVVKTIAKAEPVKKVATKVAAKVEAKPAAKASVKPAEKKVAKVKKSGDAIYATGKRKNAIAKVWLRKGTGKVVVNDKPADAYLKRAILEVVINQPFGITETSEKFDIDCQVLGGGLSGQAGAIKHAISIALQLLNPELRAPLKKAGFLTRDSRVVERKKPGLKKARKGQVFQKR